MSLRIAAYTTNSWVSPLAQLRLVGPINAAGMQLIRGVEGARIFPERVDHVDVVIVQRDFPRYPACRQVVVRARAQNIPLIFELDDWLFNLPPEHPDRISGYYASALLPMLQMTTEADLVIVSNAHLREQLESINPNIAILPNYLDEAIWTFNPTQAVTDVLPLVVGFMGGESHRPDLEMVAPVLRRVAADYGERVALHFLGASPPDVVL